MFNRRFADLNNIPPRSTVLFQPWVKFEAYVKGVVLVLWRFTFSVVVSSSVSVVVHMAYISILLVVFVACSPFVYLRFLY